MVRFYTAMCVLGFVLPYMALVWLARRLGYRCFC